MNTHQSVVWIDHQEARILRVESDVLHISTIQAQRSEPRQEQTPGDTLDEANRFFQDVARALDVADEILVVGPSEAKLEFVKFMNKNEHALDPRILGVETVADHNDARLAAYAKLYFKGRGPIPGNGH